MNLLQTPDDVLVERFRQEHPEQFTILVRMHLSFVLDLNTDDSDGLTDKIKLKKWGLIAFGKKGKSRGVMDGVPLTEEGICQVYQLIEFLKNEQNICVEGIFRRTGSIARQQELRSLLNQGVTLNLGGGQFSVHDCASVLKGFLAELPEPLLTEAHFAAYCQIADLCTSDASTPTTPSLAQPPRLLQSLQLLLLLLPAPNRALLHDLLHLLHLTTLEPRNKMTARSLATLFTPHLLCPRRLSGADLHGLYLRLSGVLAFMIEVDRAEVFRVPDKLAVDVRAFYAERERKRRVKENLKRAVHEGSVTAAAGVNESVVGDVLAAKTVYRFVDIERTALENQSNPTETALAQLYAHIQSLPESAKKRKLVKQFNRENGNGTPLQVIRSSGQMGTKKGLGDSIKKHIFNRGLIRGVKMRTGFVQIRSASEEILSSPVSSTSSNTPTSRNRLFCLKGLNTSDTIITDNDIPTYKRISTNTVRTCSDPTETGSFGPFCDSSNQQLLMADVHVTADDRLVTSDSDNRLSVVSGVELKRCASEPDLSSEDLTRMCLSGSVISDVKLVVNDYTNTNVTNYLTSTPAASRLVGFRPFPATTEVEQLDRKSMSPITRSTHAMSRAMQETMMTPRSRKPVLLISGTNINKLATSIDLTSKSCMENVQEESDDLIDLKSPPAKLHKSDTCHLSSQTSNPSLTSTFREYLRSRSLLSPTDSSFSTRSDDYKSAESNSEITDSLRLCLDGKDPDNFPDNDDYVEKEPVLKPKQFDENGKAIIFETSF